MIGEIIATIAAHPAISLLQANVPNPNGLTPDQRFEIAREALRGPGTLGVLIPLLVPIAFFAMVVLVAWFGIRRKQAVIQAQTELRKQLLAKFTTGPELTAFLESKGGQQFLEEMKWQSPRPTQAGLTVGVVFSTLGLGLLALTLAGKTHDFEVAVVFLAIGVGLLISAAIHHRLEQSKPTVNPGPGNQPVLPA